MSANPVYRFRDCQLHPATRELLRDGQPVALPSKVFDCLVYLIENRHRAVGRDELGAAVWGRTDVTDAQLSQAVLRARRAIGDAGSDQTCIKTMPKFGYGWVAEVELGEEPTATSDAVLASAPLAGVMTAPVVPAVADERSSAAAMAADAPIPTSMPDQTADQTAPAATAITPARSGARWRWAGAALLVLLVLAGLARWTWRGVSPADEATANRVLILPLDVAEGATASWIRLGGIDVLADRMRSAGMPVAPSDTTLALLRADPAGDQSKTLRRRAGAGWIVRGNVERIAGGWRVTLLAQGEDDRQFEQAAQATTVIDALDAGADGLLLQLGYAPPPTTAGSASDEARRQIKAAMLENDLAGARRLADESRALAADPFEQGFQLAMIDFREGRFEAAVSGAEAALAKLDAAAHPDLAGRIQILLGSVDLMMDRPSAAAPRFEEALRRLDPAQNPLDNARALAGRGAARFNLGELDGGMEDIHRARMALQQSGDPLAQARIDLIAGSAELLRRRPSQARTLLSTAADSLQNFGAWNERMHTMSELVQANLDLLDIDAAQVASDASMALMAQVPNTLHRAEALLYRAHLRIQQGRLVDARQLVDGYEALGLSDHARMKGLRHALLAHIAMWLGDDQQVIVEVDAALGELPDNEREIAARSVLARAHSRWRLYGPGDSGGLDELPEMLSREPQPLPIALARAERGRLRGEDPEPAFAALLERAERLGAPFDQLLVVEAWALDLIGRGQLDRVPPLLGRLAPIAGQNFRFALLEVRLAHAEGNVEAWRRALQRATAFAGDRPIPPELGQAPTPK